MNQISDRPALIAAVGGGLGLALAGATWWAQSNLGARLLPHGFCITGSPPLLWLHVISDSLICLAYLSIPLSLRKFAGLRSDIPFSWIALLFGAFIVLCGFTHAFEVWTIWDPVYWYSGILKAITAAVSLATAWVLVGLVPKAAALPSAAQLRQANSDLEEQVASRRRTEAELHAAKLEVEQRLQASEVLLRSNRDLQQFAFVAAHDLRAPLRSISGYLSMVLGRQANTLDDKSKLLIQRCVGAVEHMDGLTEGLLSYARIDAETPSAARIDCNEVLADALRLLETSIAETGAVVTAGPLPEVLAYRQQLLQLFQNLISNAIKYCAGRAPRIEVQAVRVGHEWRFSFKDNGIGIESQHTERIFRIFERLHARGEYSGNGIGLAVCQRIVERLGGRIWVESVPGEGSTFLFTLPELKVLP